MAQNFKMIYTPEGGSRREWIIDMQNPAWDITFATEKATDWPWAVFSARIEKQSAIALRALLWVLRKREEPKLSLESVIPNMDELDFAAQCPDCKDWVTTEDGDDDHVCPAPPPEQGADGLAADGEGSEPGEA